MSTKQTRRNFLFKSSLFTGGILLAPTIISCESDDNMPLIEKVEKTPVDVSGFQLGVASFDPTQNSVILWTRYNKRAILMYEISKNENFDTILRSGESLVDTATDYTLNIKVTQLEAGQKLYYRFAIKDEQQIDVSVVGETITLSENPSEVKIAATSCSFYAVGLFNVYKEIANSNADIVVHLGDYIYEAKGGSITFANEIDRTHTPDKEALTLEEYRARYKQYRSDQNLQLLHQKKPFICVWDDHEIADNTYKDGALNHNEGEGIFEDRKKDALRAYSEYLPLNYAIAGNNELIYRTFNFGSLLDLHMLDTRVIGRDEQLSLTDPKFYDVIDGKSQINIQRFREALLDEKRTILGNTQKTWLQGQLFLGRGKWQVLGQQVLMGKMLLPLEVLTSLNDLRIERQTQGQIQEKTILEFIELLKGLASIKLRISNGDTSVTELEKQRLSTVVPLNLDAWDGYPVEREAIFGTVSLVGKKLISLAGDSHNGWQSSLIGDFVQNTRAFVGHEIATPSVTSSGIDQFIGSDNSEIREDFKTSVETLIDDLNFLDPTRRGYCLITFNQSSVHAEWHFIDTVLSESYTATVGHTTNLV